MIDNVESIKCIVKQCSKTFNTFKGLSGHVKSSHRQTLPNVWNDVESHVVMDTGMEKTTETKFEANFEANLVANFETEVRIRKMSRFVVEQE